ncbi:MAG: adenylyl-sulfate kinase [Ktedonobacteraceae bacterium]
MSEHSHHHILDQWSGWSTISADNTTSFTIWFTGLPGTGKTMLAELMKRALMARGYKVEIIDTHTISFWLKHELHIEDELQEEHRASDYDAFVTYICILLARNGIITIPVLISPHQEVRTRARQQIAHFVEVYTHCPTSLRHKRMQEQKLAVDIAENRYQPPAKADVAIDTSLELPERSALRILTYLEQHGYVAPRWEENDSSDEEIATVKARLQALGYLE